MESAVSGNSTHSSGGLSKVRAAAPGSLRGPASVAGSCCSGQPLTTSPGRHTERILPRREGGLSVQVGIGQPRRRQAVASVNASRLVTQDGDHGTRLHAQGVRLRAASSASWVWRHCS